eukprot:Pgem_evm1s4911
MKVHHSNFKFTICENLVKLDTNVNWKQNLNASKIIISQIIPGTNMYDIIRAVALQLGTGVTATDLSKKLLVKHIMNKPIANNTRKAPNEKFEVVFLENEQLHQFISTCKGNILLLNVGKNNEYSAQWELHNTFTTRLIKEQDEVIIKILNYNSNVVGELNTKLESL